MDSQRLCQMLLNENQDGFQLQIFRFLPAAGHAAAAGCDKRKQIQPDVRKLPASQQFVAEDGFIQIKGLSDSPYDAGALRILRQQAKQLQSGTVCHWLNIAGIQLPWNLQG